MIHNGCIYENTILVMSMQDSLHTLSEGVYSDGDKIFTLSLNPGKKIYGERLEYLLEREYREWSYRRSKLAAYFKLDGVCIHIKKDSRILYLGAASGTTASHISDIIIEGVLYCVEFSPRSFRDLVQACEGRPNMHPILGDATRSEEYQFIVGPVDIVYQDVAQKNQLDILICNMNRFQAKYGMLAIKARSEDVSSPPHRIFTEMSRKAKAEGFQILDLLNLDPFEKDHAMMVISR